MAIFGSIALGFVMGWLCVLVGRGTRGPLGVSWSALAFGGVALLGAAILTYFYAGAKGTLATAVAFAAGAFAARIVLGARSSSGNRSNGRLRWTGE